MGTDSFGSFELLFLLDSSNQELPLLFAEPLRLRGAVVEKRENEKADDDGGKTFQQIEPLPPCKTGCTREPRKNEPLYRPSNDPRERDRGHEPGHHSRPVGSRVPIGEVEDDPGEESRFRDAKWRIAFERGLGPVSLGLLFSSGWTVVRTSDQTPVSYAITAIACVLLVRTKISPLLIMGVAGVLGALGLV
jgi:hypothetical protein